MTTVTARQASRSSPWPYLAHPPGEGAPVIYSPQIGVDLSPNACGLPELRSIRRGPAWPSA